MSNELSPFIYAQLEAAGLGEVARKTSAGEPLRFDEAQKLLKATFPLLAALVESAPPSSAAPRLRPVLYAPLNALLASGRSDQDAASLIDSELEKLQDVLPAGTPLSVAVDDWSANRLFNRLLRVIQGIRNPSHHPLAILGPSTAELKSIAQVESGEQSADFFSPAFFSDLFGAGVRSVEGGTDIRLHRLAAENGFRVTYTHNLLRSRPRGSGEEFLRELFELRAEIIPTGCFETWSPWSSFVLDSGLPKPDAPLGLELFEAVVLARLLLPEAPYIRAPLSLLGTRASEAATSLGANDFGFCAVQQDTADKLGILPLSYVLAELQAPHSLSHEVEPIIERSVESAAL